MLSFSRLKLKIKSFVKGIFFCLGMKRLFYFLDRSRRWCYYSKAGIVFVHVPKAAGSSITQELYGRRLGHHRYYDLLKECPEKATTVNFCTLVRNPYARLYSAWEYIRSAGTRDGIVAYRHSYDDPSFQSFDSFVTIWLQGRDVDLEDPVLKSQFYYLRDGDELPGNIFIGCVESMDASIDGINHFSKFPIKKIHTNSNNKKTSNLSSVYTAEMIELVNLIYAKDFCVFGYRKLSSPDELREATNLEPLHIYRKSIFGLS